MKGMVNVVRTRSREMVDTKPMAKRMGIIASMMARKGPPLLLVLKVVWI
jgi:hypothetical protein